MFKEALTKIITKTFRVLLSYLRDYDNHLKFSRQEIRHLKYSFSQFGEDLIVLRFLRKLDPSKGIYIDCGAFDPVVISNTLLLYKKGYQGINIDLDEDKISKFNLLRPNDYNVVAALYNKKTKLLHLKYPGKATNRILELGISECRSIIGELPISSSIIETTTLNYIIESSPFKEKEIHYLNIDCEGHDLVILEGLDFNQYAPKVISIEVHEAIVQEQVRIFLKRYNYTLSAMLEGNLIFTHETLKW